MAEQDHGWSTITIAGWTTLAPKTPPEPDWDENPKPTPEQVEIVRSGVATWRRAHRSLGP